jgi:Domain of unknown function (DUF222)
MRLSQLRDAMQDCARDFEASRLSAPDAAKAIEHAAAIKNMAAGIEAMAAARVAATNEWKREGDRSAAHHLARTTGVSITQASDTLKTAQRLSDAPATEAALRSGELSLQQATVIADAVVVNPEAEQELLDQAGRASLGELRSEACRKKATGIDLEARRARIHERRGLRHWVDTEGVAHVHWADNPERVAEAMTALAGPRDELFKKARKAGRRESLEAYAADALYEVLTGKRETKGGSSHKVIVRVDLERLLRGHAEGDDVCEIAGYGPVAASAVKELLDTKHPFLAAVLTKGRDVVNVVHFGRRPTAHQQTALQWLYPECEVEGCHNSVFLEWDHTEDWAKTHRTLLECLSGKCPFHHDLKTTQGWDLVVGTGKRPMVPPDDPRHPRHAQQANAPPEVAA